MLRVIDNYAVCCILYIVVLSVIMPSVALCFAECHYVECLCDFVTASRHSAGRHSGKWAHLRRDTHHNKTIINVECRVLYIVMLSVIALSVAFCLLLC
jgi:hypothetical protein